MTAPPSRPAPGTTLLWPLLLILILLPITPVRAGSLQVAPIQLEFDSHQNAQMLWLTNSGSTPLRAQVRVQQWTQVDARDVLQPSDQLLASPPIIEMAPGQQQLVRLVRADPTPGEQESAFRLLVDELPHDPTAASPGLQLLLRYSIPVFVLPVGATPQLSRAGRPAALDVRQLRGSWQREGNSARLTLTNGTPQRVRISQLQWVTEADQRTVLIPGLLGYVLAGNRMQWNIPVPPGLPANGTLHAKLNDDADTQPLPQVTPGH